jgi:hypothetical protein
MKLKLLTVLLGQPGRRLGRSLQTPPLVPFVWATGGHSASAGHGNLWSQSYTAAMERGAKPLFAAAGLDFVGRNYAMGGTASAPEQAFCVDAVYGTDIDVLSWDFGMVSFGRLL